MKIADLPPKQAARYLKELQSFEPHRQLLIKVGGGLLKEETAVQELADALAELAGNGIHTVLVHGGGIQLNAALKRLKVTPRFIDGKRYTDEVTLKEAKAVFRGIGEELVGIFEDTGLKALALPSETIFKAKHDPELGLVGTEITSIDTDAITSAAKDYPVVIVRPLTGDDKSAGTLNINADTVFRALATGLKPHRMASLTPTGGVLRSMKNDNTPQIITGISLRDIDALIDDGIVSGGMALKLRELASVLEKLEVGSAISITKPSELLQELLTDRGSGTFICKGQKIISTDDLDGLYTDLAALIVEVFGKALPENYQEQKFDCVYCTGDHMAFGIVTKLSDGMPYLDKLAVSPQLQGRGIGESMWYCIARDYPKIVWRSHVDNRYSTWYHRHADIMKRSGEWILFGRGIGFKELESLEDEMAAIPPMR